MDSYTDLLQRAYDLLWDGDCGPEGTDLASDIKAALAAGQEKYIPICEGAHMLKVDPGIDWNAPQPRSWPRKRCTHCPYPQGCMLEDCND